jgi:hypothetical protein
MRLSLLQRALRRRLLNPMRNRLVLNRSDPLGQSFGFTELDGMVDALWPETDAVQLGDVINLAESSR